MSFLAAHADGGQNVQERPGRRSHVQGSAAVQEVQAWGAVYDEAYSAQTSANSDPSLNFSGYDNSYTPRSPHQIPVVREWVETTCERIAALQPRRALEMGCGQGMIMLRCAKVARQLYVACDLSQFSVNYCRHILASDPRFELPHVRLSPHSPSARCPHGVPTLCQPRVAHGAPAVVG